MKNSYRITLLGSAITAATFIAAAPAQAACVVSASAVTCSSTTTTDTTFPVNVPNDRHYPVDTSAAAFTGTVSTGAVVDGFGLAFTNTLGGNALNVINNGAVQINAGNTATQGGASALDITAIGATSVNYSGAGTITNLSTSGSGLRIDSAGTGSLTANVGGSVTNSSPNAFAVLLFQNGTAGNVAVTTAAGTNIRSIGGGVAAIIFNPLSAGTVSLTNNATIGSLVGAPGTIDSGLRALTSGLGSVTLVNTGAIGSATDRTVVGGIEARITNVASAAAVSVSGTGAIFTAGNGIEADNRGTGTLTVNYTGAIDAGGTGLLANAASGATTLTTGPIVAGGSGIVANATTGTIVANVNGNVTSVGTGVGLTSTGAKTVNVATGVTVNSTGGTDIAFGGGGTGTVTNSGVIGADSLGLAIAGATTITNNATGTINGRVTLSAGADTFTNSGTFNTQGISDFGLGADVLTNNAAGTINILGATTFAGLETFNQNGRINLNSNTLTLAGTAFTNGSTGFIDTTGNASILGITSFSNAGTLDLAAGTFTVPAVAFTNRGIIIADEGASTITGQTSFANSGTIDLQDGATGDFLTIASSFVGSGGSNLLIDSSGMASDRLIVTGAASGSTVVNVNLLTPGFFDATGLLVADNGTSSANAFVLGTINNTNLLLDYNLEQRGADFFLTAEPTAAAFEPLSLAAAATDMWYQSADEVISQIRLPHAPDGIGVWGQVYASRDRFGDRDDSQTINGIEYDVNTRTKNRRMGIQGGVDFGFGGGRVGVTGGYAKNKVSSAADLRIKGWNLGLYGQFGGDVGFHAEGLIKTDRYTVNVNDGAFDGERSRLRSTGVDGAIGYRMGMGGASVDVNAGLSHVWTKIGGIGAFDFDYDYDRMTSTRGRAGVRAVFGEGFRPYVDATVHHEFNGKGNVTLFDGVNDYDLDYSGKGTWVRLEAGIGGSSTGVGPILAAWADLGDKKGIGARLGFRFGGGARAEALPPPPPPVVEAPPPPPPPATQTCSDGSVILATDMCPPPPPPPPPPPEPERG